MHMAYSLLNELEGVVPYRYVYDYASDTLEALEPDAPMPRDLDLLLVSLPYELDYPYAARCLAHGGIRIPLKSERRPVVVGGGVAASSNPAPLLGVLDAVVIGDAEGILEELPYIARDEGAEGLCKLGAVLVYGFCSERVRKNVAMLSAVPRYALMQAHPLEEEPIYGCGLRLEVSRGCPRMCAFCLEGHVTRPFRFYSESSVMDAIERWLDVYPFKRVVIYSLSLLDVPYARRLLEELRNMSVEASVPSLRPDYVDENIVELVRDLGQKTLTIAPESLNPEVACRVGKCYDPSDLAKVIEKARGLGMNVKLYLIAGLPGESPAELAKGVKRFLDTLSEPTRRAIRISINPLIPKPWTPTQFLSHSYPYVVSKDLRKALRGVSASCDVMDWRWGVVQAFIALGDESTSRHVVDWGLEGFRASEARKLLRYESRGRRVWEVMVDLGIPASYLRSRFEYLSSFDERWRSAGEA